MNTRSKFNLILIRMAAVLLFLFPVILSAVPVEFPDTPAGKRAAEILALLNGTFSRPAEDYIQNDYAPAFRDSFPMARHKQIFDTTKGMFGMLELSEIVSSSDMEIRFVLRSESRNASLNMTLNVETEPPHRIALIGIRPGAPASSPSGAGREVTPTEEKSPTPPPEAKKQVVISPGDLDKMIASKAAAGEFSGVVLVARDGSPIYHKAYGYASKRFKVPNTVNTKFNL
ncbi:MAG: beta-lactamase family protein, partial [Candidatus Aminicenantes bacterium]|nr:beta-lactamase family protein [Candidatus Aminicenantes bacterium]